MNWQKLLVALGLVWLGLMPASVRAQTTRSISRSVASGVTAQTVRLEVGRGRGLNLSFIEVGETIERVWLDDPSRFVLDTDGCSIVSNDCEVGDPMPTMLHLKQIERLDFPGVLEADPKSGTLLTVVTRDERSQRRIYTFEVVPEQGRVDYNTVALTADPLSLTLDLELDRIRRGRERAAVARQLDRADDLWQRIDRVLTLIEEDGLSMEAAATEAGVTLPLLERLAELGD
ncbi:MAG: hypothetical protein SWY16_25205 [Cyanobacteriota bacterium]|nr:hypothetical protein [Cyanobacteriota bacterium]